MQVSRSFPRQEEGPRTGGNRQGEHPLHVPRHGNEGPLTLDIFEPTQQELAEAITDLMIRTPAPGSACARHRASCLRASADVAMASSGVGFSGRDMSSQQVAE